jgi:RNAse (barnase) inhibitor barstar
MKTYIINWNHLTSLDDFYNQIETLFLQNSDLDFWRNLDGLNDILYWWFWSFKEQETIEIIWENFEKSKKYVENIDIIEEIFESYEHINFRKK